MTPDDSLHETPLVLPGSTILLVVNSLSSTATRRPAGSWLNLSLLCRMALRCSPSLLLLVACSGEPTETVRLNEPFRDEEAATVIATALPGGWSVHESQPDQLPKGHFNEGHGGELIRLVGPEPVSLLWREGSGPWQSEPLAREVINLWILPGHYEPAPRPRGVHHAHVPATEVFRGEAVAVYGEIAHVIVDQSRFDAVLKMASSTGWTDIAGRQVSWEDWRQDLASALREYEDGS